MPLFNDERWVAGALESSLQQTCSDIEIICIDDASTDRTCAVVEQYQRRDPRVRLVRQGENLSAFQARRVGVEQARAPYVLFLDGDDELIRDAVDETYRLATQSGADIVGFGVEIITDDGGSTPRFERTLQPTHNELTAPDIIPLLFPVGEAAQGHIWRYLFATDLLRSAYEGFARDLRMYRANDFPISFLAIAYARKYVSTKKRLYRYAFRRGASGHEIANTQEFRFYLGAIDSIESIKRRVELLSDDSDDRLVVSYRSARIYLISNLLMYCVQKVVPSVRSECFNLLCCRVGMEDVVRASSTFAPDSLGLVAEKQVTTRLRSPLPKTVLLTTGNLRMGGVQGVATTQARYLVEAGFKVVVAIFSADASAYDLPSEVELVRLDARTCSERVEAWIGLIRDHSIDLIVDHHILYNDYWPFLVAAARALGVPTIGWLHNFALRPIFDLSSRTTFLTRFLPLLQQFVVLSTVDVAYWKMRGLSNVCYLPNPPSPFLKALLEGEQSPKTLDTETLEIIWWGRLQQSTKQVRDLVSMARQLHILGVSFRLSIIGPDGCDLSASDLRDQADREGVSEFVEILGPLQGAELQGAISDAQLFVSTSVIEGYPLTLVEAQAMGLPVVMYDLPWLSVLQENSGAVTVAQGHVDELAGAIADITRDRSRYADLSAGSLVAARKALGFDFAELYTSLLRGDLPTEFHPEPSIEDARLILEWSSYYADRNAVVVKKREHELTKSSAALVVENKKLQKLNKTANKRIQTVRRSWSFKLGRAITFVPRAIRNLAKGVLKGSARDGSDSH